MRDRCDTHVLFDHRLLYETALHDYEKAKEIYEECVTKFTVKLGEHHPLTQKAKRLQQRVHQALEPEPEA